MSPRVLENMEYTSRLNVVIFGYTKPWRCIKGLKKLLVLIDSHANIFIKVQASWMHGKNFKKGMICLYDTFEVNGSGSFIQFHECMERDLVTFLKTRKMSHHRIGAVCNSISHTCIQSIISLAVNRYLDTSSQYYEANSDITKTGAKTELDGFLKVLERLYEAVFPLEQDFAVSEIVYNEESIPKWILNHGNKAKKALETITSNLSDISIIISDSRVVVGNYDLYRKSRIENVKNACNTFYYHLINSAWNLRIGHPVWSSMANKVFNPKCWCELVANQLRNHDNSVAIVDASVYNGEGFYFTNPLDCWQIQNLLEMCELLGQGDMFSIRLGKRNCCGKDVFLVYSASNFNTLTSGVKQTEPNEELPELWYVRPGTKEWVVIPKWVYN